MEDQQEEVLFETWLYKQGNLNNKRTISFTSAWKKKYFVLKRFRDGVTLLYYDAKPKDGKGDYKGKIALNAWFRVEKKYYERGKPFVCEITTPGRKICVGTNDEKIFHLFAFFMQVQVKLKEEFEDECFVVRPENTEDIRKIGAKGNMCLLNISRWGLTIALQLSKCVVGQWPLKTIKSYESTGRGHFAFETGRSAPMGEGHYRFSTRVSQDTLIYDSLDKYVMEAAGLREATTPERQNGPTLETLESEHEHLRSLTYVFCDPNFTSHIRRISRDIYDHLWQHLAGERTKASTADLSIASDTLSRQDLSRSESVATAVGQPVVPMLKSLSQSGSRATGQLPQHAYENNSVEVPTMARPIRSQYMQMGSPSVTVGTPSPPNLPNSTPPPSFIEALQHPGGYRSGYPSNSSTLDRHRNIPHGAQARKLVNYNRQHSRSMDDITDPSRIRAPYVYNNNSYETGDVSPLHTIGFSYVSADKAGTVPKRYRDVEADDRYVRESQAPGAGVEFLQGATGEDYAVPYTQVRPGPQGTRLRKSVSNPELLESALREEDARYTDSNVNHSNNASYGANRPTRPNMQNWNYLKSSPMARRRTPSETSATTNVIPNSSVRVISPAVESIHSSGKTKIFKRQASKDSYLGANNYPEEGRERTSMEADGTIPNGRSSPNNLPANVSETLC